MNVFILGISLVLDIDDITASESQLSLNQMITHLSP